MSEVSTSTRERILDVCLRLFNESGPAAVTTAEIARTAGINEGNLYYYFKKKEDILLALFEAFEAALNEVANASQDTGDAGDGSDAALAYLQRWFRLMWAWRFFYRDGAAIKRMAPGLRARTVTLADRGQADIKRALKQMVKRGLLVASDEELERLVVNAWIISSYWLDYLDTRHNVGRVTRDHLEWGFAQVLSLFLPYTRPGVPPAFPASRRKSPPGQ
ncbi:TetR/AcrR family transcriptional regulator [Noviherbaspirillum sp.]|uniref:TetR/AcrR family transcriptional regulator n=1 Tax=Noviherbaspirillum sp. TaxID=1926288 RepID=UPI002D3B637D|nr:TetR/AcrR family transcriptional regulator [Noviherbaspirillum sp.]HZW20157.1 TetR/AcrR family transcriptional regulator [Noviherbaspirillum sp.]